MAPSRRRGAGKTSSAAAAAARLKWKVGDLVLAKVKGFPAWPATVSEPEKWGYSTDMKKVLVYFFGTKQIAFCNPADVEAFTEEKKKALLIKCQGKGADFVRAVEEIIDSYEKSKKQDQDDEFNSGDEGTVSNAGKLEGSVGKSWKKVQMQSTVVMPNSPGLENLCASTDRNESCNPVEVAAAAIEIADLHGVETASEEPIINATFLDHHRETTLATTNSLIRLSRGTPLQSCVIQKKAPSIRRSRSSSRVDPCKFPNLKIPLSDGSKAKGGIVPNVMRDESLRRNKRIRKSPDTSVWHDMESPVHSAAFVSNGSSEDNGSEIVATSSDTISLNEGSTLEPSYQNEHPDIVDEYLERGVELSERVHLRAEAVVLKKKRKPNRKRGAHGATALAASPSKESGLEVGVSKTIPIPSNACEKSDERFCKVDGDEHLPLVKRARARMRKPPTEEDELNNFIDTEDKPSKEVSMNHSELVSTSLCCADSCPIDRTSLEVKGAVNGSSPLNGCTHRTENELFWKAKKYQLRCCSVDGEAALPPSKRLHRALEAMSANAAEDGQAYIESQGTTKMISNGCSDSSEKSSHVALDGNTGSGLEVRNVNYSGDIDNDTYLNGTSGSLPSLTSTSDVPAKAYSEMQPCDHLAGSSTSPKLEDCKQMLLIDARNFVDLKDLDDSSTNTHTGKTEIHVKSAQFSSKFDEKQGSLESCAGSLNQSSLSMKEDKNDILGPCNESSDDILKVDGAYSQAEKSDREHGMPRTNLQRLDSISEANAVGKFSPPSTKVFVSVSKGNSCESRPLQSPSYVSSRVKGMCEIVKEVKHKLTQKDVDASPYATSMKVLIAAAQAKRHSSHATLFNSALDDKVVSDAVSSPSLTHRVASSEQVFSSNSSICHLSTVDNRNYLVHNGNISPDVLPYYKKTTNVLMEEEGNLESMVSHRQKSLGKWMKAEANVALRSFETMLGTLSRTKESIGRATRLAIDCAKYGIADEVVDLLLRNLESESSLHKRVDLFFLVDSITQCSRGQKGDVGDIYPSAVQSVLPRLLSAAAPPGNAARENRKQCLKVLRLWLERKTLPDFIVRHHMRELDSITDAPFSSASSRRPSRTERALNDPVREMEGMLVDEYGSNASFQLPGFLMPRMLEDDEEGSDADEKSFEAVTPEQDPEIPEEREATPTSTIEKHRHILEDVDGELEMEDVAPSCEVEMNSTYHFSGVDTVHTSQCQFEQHLPLPFAPPLPEDMPPSPPPLPTSPPPMAPPLPPPASVMSLPLTDNVDSNLYMSTHSVENCLQQPMSLEPDTSSVKSMTLDTVHNYAPRYRDFASQMQRPGSSSSSASCCSLPGTHPSMQTGNNVQQIEGAPLHKGYHLQPPPPMLSNQFSYFQADHRMQSWGETLSSSFSKRFQFGHDVHRENIYDNQDRMKLAPHEIGPRIHSDNPEALYASASYYGPPCEPTRILNRGWSFPPRALNYGHPTPLRPPESTISGANGAPNFWRPR